MLQRSLLLFLVLHAHPQPQARQAQMPPAEVRADHRIELFELLGEYEAARGRYPTLGAFMPRIAAYYDELADRIDGMTAAMGGVLLTEEEYRGLQQLGELDTKTSSWLSTPADVSRRGPDLGRLDAVTRSRVEPLAVEVDRGPAPRSRCRRSRGGRAWAVSRWGRG